MPLRTVRNCTIEWKLRCPKTWDTLAATDGPSVRFCAQCERNVYHCATDEETITHARAGECVARDEPAADELPALVLGRVSVEPSSNEREAAEWRRRERGIDQIIVSHLEAERRCPSCSYPIPKFRKTCYVCGADVGRDL